MSEALTAVCDQLKLQLSRALLDQPLDALTLDQLDDEARELLADMHAAGVAETLGELLGDGVLTEYAERSLTAREHDLLLHNLQGLLRSGAVGPDDPGRLVNIPAPPASASALQRWADTYGMASELKRPARELLPQLPARMQDSVLNVCSGELAPARGQSLLDVQRSAEQLRASLWREARRAASTTARIQLWKSPRPQGPLRVLVERLHALLDGASPEALHTLEFSATQPVQLHSGSGTCLGRLRGSDGSGDVEAKLFLLGFEQRALSSQCSACRREGCLHVKALAGRLLDACLWAPDALHTPVLKFVSTPSWQRFFDALEPAREREEAGRERLSFVVRTNGDTVAVAVLLALRGADGAFSPGRMVTPQRALTRPACSDADRPALEALAVRARTLSPGFVLADFAVLRALVDHASVLLDTDKQPLRLMEQAVELKLNEQPDGFMPELFLADHKLLPGARAKSLNYLLVLNEDQHTLTFASLTPALARLLAALDHYRGVLPKESYPLLAPYVASLKSVARVELPKALLGLELPIPRRLLLRFTPSFDEGLEVNLCVRPLPLSGLWPPGSGPELVHGLRDGSPSHTRRDLAWERSTAEQIKKQLHLEDTLYIEAFRWRVETTQHALELLTRAAKLIDQLTIEWAEHVQRPEVLGSVQAGDLKVGLFKRGALLFVEGKVESATTSLAFSRLLDAARRNERFVVIEGNHYLEIEAELFQRLMRAQLCVMDTKLGRAVPSSAAPFWLAQLGDVTRGEDAESRALLEHAGSLDTRSAVLPSQLTAELRDYQREGIAFLLQRAEWSPGACLADEMGLGKTVQAIGLLAARAHLGASMVVCPTSLVDNWRNELTRFAPTLTPLVYRGAQRKKQLEKLGAGSVLITSYQLLLRDRHLFEERHFGTQVIDEAQVVKNARSLRARAVASMAAEFRLALTGTPVENRLGDLWSLFHLLAPSLLGSWPRFRARFAVPIERYDSAERKQDLRSLVAPFILRRTKDEVLKELPLRSEVVHMVQLSKPEQHLYQAALREAKRAIGKRKKSDQQRTVHILAELTRLRQLACHPRLVLPDERVESSKLNALLTVLDDILPRGHRALIFSQFVAHLQLVREALLARNIRLLWLSGETPGTERSQLVERFQRGEAEVFLISLKAGGTGLNLTRADYVIHLDPWWNPAAEDQASDRSHRIGQERPVTIVKLVAEDTIEERVLALHQHKRRLADAVLGVESDSSPASFIAQLWEEQFAHR